MNWNHPIAFWGFVGLPFIVYFIVRNRKQRALKIRQAFGDEMRSRIFPKEATLFLKLKRIALFLATIFLLIALCGPRYGRELETHSSYGRDLFVVFDVSDSMLAEDVSPNRLAVAKLDVEDLLNAALGDRIGLITFSGSAQVEIPLTTDYEFYRALLRKVDTSTIKLGGTAIGDAVRLALQRFDHDIEREKAIILITDGEDHDSRPLEAARKAVELKVPVYTIALGTESGAKIPIFDVNGRRVGYKRFDGEEVVSKPDVATLKEMASLSNGLFYYADANFDLGAVYRNAIDAQKRSELSETTRVVFKDRYQPFLAIGIISLLIYYVLPSYRIRRDVSATLTSRSYALWVVALAIAASSQSASLFATDAKSTTEEIDEYNRSLTLARQGQDAEFIAVQEKLAASNSRDVSERANYNLGVAAFNRVQKLAEELNDQVVAYMSESDQNANRPALQDATRNNKIKEYSQARTQRDQLRKNMIDSSRESTRYFMKSVERNAKSFPAKLSAQTVFDQSARSQEQQDALERELRNNALNNSNDHVNWLRNELDAQIDDVRKNKTSEPSIDFYRALDSQRARIASIKDDVGDIISTIQEQNGSEVNSSSPQIPTDANPSETKFLSALPLDLEATNAITHANEKYKSQISTAAQLFDKYDADNALNQIRSAKSQLELVDSIATDYDKIVITLEKHEEQANSEVVNGSSFANGDAVEDYYWRQDALRLVAGEMTRKASLILANSPVPQENDLQSVSNPPTNDEDEIEFDSNEPNDAENSNRETKVIKSAKIAQDRREELLSGMDDLLRLTHNKQTLTSDEKEDLVAKHARITDILHEIAAPLKDDNSNRQDDENQQKNQAQQDPQDQQNNNGQQDQSSQQNQQNNQQDQNQSENDGDNTPQELNEPEKEKDEARQNRNSEKDDEVMKKDSNAQELVAKEESQEKRAAQKQEEKTELQKEADALMKIVERRQKDAEPQRRAVRQALKKKEKSGKDW